MGARTAGNVYIEGFDYYHGIEKDIAEKGLNPTMPHLNCRKIAVVHAFITPEKWLPQVLHIAVPDIKTSFDLVLVAHNHAEWGIIKQGLTTFISIGSLARLTIAKHDLERMPNVLFVDTEASILKVIPLESAKQPSEVFDLDKIKEGKSFETSIENFIASLDSTKFQSLNLRGVIEELGRNQGISREVIDEIINRMGEFEQ
jgi:hypothetical protein